MDWKRKYTKTFLKQLNKPIDEELIKHYTSEWWKNPVSKKQGGLRLTDEGFRVIVEDLELQVYEVPYSSKLEFTTRILLWIDNFVKCPYYLGRSRIYVTDEKVALELHLFSGDLEKYGLSKAMARHEKE